MISFKGLKSEFKKNHMAYPQGSSQEDGDHSARMRDHVCDYRGIRSVLQLDYARTGRYFPIRRRG